MASIQERRNKQGRLISFSIRVHRGRDSNGVQLKPYTATFKVSPTWKEASARKKAEAFAAQFEAQVRAGTLTDTRETFSAYCDYVISLKERLGIKHSTIARYKALTERIYPALGHIKLKDLKADNLNRFYFKLSASGENKRTGGKLSAKSIIEHHRLISAVLAQAVKEGLLPFNPASRADVPKLEKKEVNYFQPADAEKILEALNNEPLKWRALVSLLLMTGARRGEILALKWHNIDFKRGEVFIEKSVLYSSDIGIYETEPKTEKSKRHITIPQETLDLLSEYRQLQTSEQVRLGAHFIAKDYVFARDDGKPMHPDSVTGYLSKFSARYGLPHINPHAFRHTMASMLYYNGVDSVSISRRLGHAQVSTTANIYAHVIEKADKESADILSKTFYR